MQPLLLLVSRLLLGKPLWVWWKDWSRNHKQQQRNSSSNNRSCCCQPLLSMTNYPKRVLPVFWIWTLFSRKTCWNKTTRLSTCPHWLPQKSQPQTTTPPTLRAALLFLKTPSKFPQTNCKAESARGKAASTGITWARTPVCHPEPQDSALTTSWKNWVPSMTRFTAVTSVTLCLREVTSRHPWARTDGKNLSQNFFHL